MLGVLLSHKSRKPPGPTHTPYPCDPKLTSEHYMQDLADEYVVSLVSLHSAAKVIMALMETESIFQMLQLKPEVEEIRRYMRRADGSSMGVFADSLAQVPCWKAKLDAYVSSTNAAEIHLSKMKEVRAFLEKRSLRADPKTVMMIARDLGFLQSELPQKAFESFMSEGLAFCKEYWAHCHVALEGGIWQHEQQPLQECMTECNLVWPEESCFSEAVQQLAQMAAAKSGQSKIGEFMKCLEPIAETLKCEHLTAAAVEDVRKHSRLCKGMAFSDEQQKIVHTAVDTLQAAALCSWSSGDGAAAILEMTECVEAWFARHQGPKLEVMHLYEALQQSFGAWKEVSEKFTSLKAGPEKEALASLVRSHNAAKQHLEDASKTDWAKKELRVVMETAGENLAATEKMLIEVAKDGLEKQAAKVNELMALAGCGDKSWTESITAIMVWEEAVQVAGGTLAKIPYDRLELETKDLYEVSRSSRM